MSILNPKRIIPYVELENCAGCKEPFKTGQECWAINYEGESVIHSCPNCWKNIPKRSLYLLDNFPNEEDYCLK